MKQDQEQIVTNEDVFKYLRIHISLIHLLKSLPKSLGMAPSETNQWRFAPKLFPETRIDGGRVTIQLSSMDGV